MYMNVIRTVICTLIILPVGLQAATSHSSMVKDTITIVATGNQNTVFETPSMVSVVTNDTPWSQNAVTSAGMLKGVAGAPARLVQDGPMGRPLIYAAMTKAGYLFLLTAFANSVTWQKAVALIWIRHSSNVSKLSAGQTPVCTAVAGWEV